MGLLKSAAVNYLFIISPNARDSQADPAQIRATWKQPSWFRLLNWRWGELAAARTQENTICVLS